MKKRLDLRQPQLGNRAIIDRDVCLPIETRRIKNSVRFGRMVVKRQRPRSPCALSRSPDRIGRYAHADAPVAAHVHEPQRRAELDLSKQAIVEFRFLDWIVADRPVSLVSE